MSLLSGFLSLTRDWREVFPQDRTFQRGLRQALGSLVCLGRRCLTRIIWTNGGRQRSWSADISYTRAAGGSRNSCSGPF